MKKAFIFLLFLLATLTSRSQPFLFGYFTGNGEGGLHLAYSRDGLTWSPLKNGESFLTSTLGDSLMRDPSIWLGPDGTFHMVWTTGWHDRIIGYASSKDLIEWTQPKAIPVMMHEPEARHSWAPELFYDEPSSLYYILWATTIPGRHTDVPTTDFEKGNNPRIYCTTTPDFETFSETRLFFNPDFTVIDAAIVTEPDGGLLMILKNENSAPPEKNLRVTRTRNISEGFPVEVSEPIHPPCWAEGPSPLWVGDYLYVYFDKYMFHQYGGVRSKDGTNWEDVSDRMTFPSDMRHGTAFPVPEATLDRLLKE